MQSIRLTRTVPIAGTDLDILRNQAIGYAERPSMVNVFAVNETASAIEMEVAFGTQKIVQRSAPATRAGAGPNKPDDLIGSGFAPAGAKIQIDLFNTDTLVARVCRIAVDVQPVA